MLRMTASFYVGKFVGGVIKGDMNSVEEDMGQGGTRIPMGHLELELPNEYFLNSIFCMKNPIVHRVSLVVCIFEN